MDSLSITTMFCFSKRRLDGDVPAGGGVSGGKVVPPLVSREEPDESQTQTGADHELGFRLAGCRTTPILRNADA